ncbi:MAG: DEAD/DEAH box helicase [Pseudomonadota bacterium]
MTTFDQLALTAQLKRALAQEGHDTPTPIQAAAIPPALDGKDILGIAQTGTGKTAAFLLPLLNQIASHRQRPAPKTARALILTPTRELAVQILDRVAAYSKGTKASRALVIGGASMNQQRRALSRGVDVLVATPGRLVDLVKRDWCDLSHTEFLVLDEADQMLDMGFIHAIRHLRSCLPDQIQSLLFSATMPKQIERFVAEMLVDPVRVEVTPVSKTADKVEQSVLFVSQTGKPAALAEILRQDDVERVLVFARTKHGADKIVKSLATKDIEAAAIHGNKSQNARQRALNRFAKGELRVLIGTDIAARGIDIKGITHVVQYDLPEVPETYVHRIGRTARAEASGVAIALCSAGERHLLKAIEKVTRLTIPVAEGSAEQTDDEIAKAKAEATRNRQQRGRRPGPRPGSRNTAKRPPKDGRSKSGNAGPSRRPKRKGAARPKTAVAK